MIRPRTLVATVVRNAVRNRGQFALSAFGVIVGVAALVFFLALSSGIRSAILADFSA